MCSIVKPAYKLKLDDRGLFQLSTSWGGVLIDRGGLNEWIDRRSSIPDQAARDGVHWLQIGPAVVHGSGDYAVSRGLLSKPSRVYGGMAWRNEIRAYDRFFTLRVWRRFLIDCAMVDDDSICFLSPAARTWTFHCGADHYKTRRNGEKWKDVEPDTGLLVRRETIERIIGHTTTTGWAAMLGGRGGVGVILMRYSPGAAGILRLTRPEKKAERKFDEIEFQWDVAGARRDTHTETGQFLIAPIREWREIAELHRQLVDGELKL